MSHETTIDLQEAKRRQRLPAPVPAATNPGYVSARLFASDPLTWQPENIPEREWLVPQWIPMPAVTMIGGAGGGGKSLIAQQLMTACATGRKWLGLQTSPCRAVGVFCEDELPELQRRQARINDEMGLNFGDLENMRFFPRIGQENALHIHDWETRTWRETELCDQIMAEAVAFGAQLIVLDSLYDFFRGNENARPDVHQFVGILQSLAHGIDGAVVVTAHPSKSGQADAGYSGSTAWEAKVRARIYLDRPKMEASDAPDPDARILKRKKANYANGEDEIKLRWRDGVFIAEQASFGMVAHLEGNIAEAVFLDLLARREAEGRPVSHKTRAGNYAPKEFAKSPGRQGCTKCDFERAMEALFASGAITVVEYGRSGDRREKIIKTGTEGQLI